MQAKLIIYMRDLLPVVFTPNSRNHADMLRRIDLFRTCSYSDAVFRTAV